MEYIGENARSWRMLVEGREEWIGRILVSDLLTEVLIGEVSDIFLMPGHHLGLEHVRIEFVWRAAQRNLGAVRDWQVSDSTSLTLELVPGTYNFPRMNVTGGGLQLVVKAPIPHHLLPANTEAEDGPVFSCRWPQRVLSGADLRLARSACSRP